MKMGHLADLLKNRVNSQWNPSLYEVWKPMIAEDIEKWMVRRLCKGSKVPGTCMGMKAAVTPGLVPGAGHQLLQEIWRRAILAIATLQLPPLPEQGRQSRTRRDLDA